MILGVTGKNSSGKGEIANFLKSKGFIAMSLSDEIREEARKLNLELTRDNLRALGNKMREAEGNNVLAKRILQRVDPNRNYVLESIRNPAEVLELKSNPEFTLVAVDCPAKLRFARALERNRERDPLKFEDFMKNDLLEEGKDENGNVRKDSNQNIGECMRMAHFTILNDCDLGTLSERIKELMDGLGVIV
jgi:dephospho-CoA kinase